MWSPVTRDSQDLVPTHGPGAPSQGQTGSHSFREVCLHSSNKELAGSWLLPSSPVPQLDDLWSLGSQETPADTWDLNQGTSDVPRGWETGRELDHHMPLFSPGERECAKE